MHVSEVFGLIPLHQNMDLNIVYTHYFNVDYYSHRMKYNTFSLFRLTGLQDVQIRNLIVML